MTTQPVLETEATVGSAELADGRMVRIAGEVDGTHLVALRSALLSPLPPGCRDVVVDAGGVRAICDDAIAVLLAAPMWAESCGGRLLLSQSSPALDGALAELELFDLLPRLESLPAGRTRDLVPVPRPSAD